MTASRNCGSRQGLLEALTLAVELVHPAAVRSIVDYVANPLTDDELSQLVQALRTAADCDDWPQNMTRPAQTRLLDRINHAKTRYATYLRARNQHDIQIKWSYEHSLQSLGMLHSKDLATFFEGLWTRRYTQFARGNLGPQSYRSFSVILSSSEFARLCEFVKDRRIDVSENVLQTFGPLETGSAPRSLQEIHLRMVEALHDIHNHRFEIATPTTERGNEPWFPFPNVVRQSSEVIAPHRIENMMGRKLDFIKDWDSGKAGDVVLKNAAPARPHGHRVSARRKIPQHRGKLPPHWKVPENEQREGFFTGKLGDKSARGAVRWPELPAIKEDRQYNKAARRPPPKDFQMEALSHSGEDAGSVAVASLSTVTGDLQRMKSFVWKPSRGEMLQPNPTAQEVEIAQADALPTPPSPSSAIPMSGRPPRNTGLATPPDSASPVKPQRPESSTKRFNRRAPSAASKVKPRRPQMRRSPSNRTDTSSTTTVTSRTGSTSSMEAFNKESIKSSTATADTSADSPPSAILWSQPFENFKTTARCRSSGLDTYSPTKQATTSVQHVEVAAQRSSSESHIVFPGTFEDVKHIQADGVSSQKFRTKRVDSTISSAPRSAIHALRHSIGSREEGAVRRGCEGRASHHCAASPREHSLFITKARTSTT